MADAIPDWLAEMRRITGLSEKPGSADEPKILAMADYIAKTFPDMANYCAQYRADATPWCGLCAAYCMACADPPIRPPFGKIDTDRFLWAQAWGDDPKFGTVISSPRVGCVVVLKRSGGGHVAFYESTSGSNYMLRGGNQSDAINVKPFPKSSVIALVWPREGVPTTPDVPQPVERRELSSGDTGPDVVALQKALGIPADGEFGPVTETQVKGFQAACDLDPDGVVGPNTWKEVDALVARVAAGSEGLAPELAADIEQLAERSPLMSYSWPDRGRAPPGYIPGMALSFAVAMQWLNANDSAATLMAKAVGGPDTDALKWLEQQFLAVGMRNDKPGIDILRHTFVLLIGLAMRESSGQYCEGRDMSATNTTADTCESGLTQQSWNSRAATAELPKLLNVFWQNPNGFLETFNDGVEPSANDLAVYGTGGGARFQFLAKYCPLFAVMCAAVGVRVLKRHWGPLQRKEVTLNPDADALLLSVQQLVEAAAIEPPPPLPVPSPEVVKIKMRIEAPANVKVAVDVEQVEV
jgi:uncharacterized protein (TIGR02594 family)